MFDDQYSLYKAFNSKKLLVAFVEFMFEDIEPKNLTEKEESIFNSLRERMENSKQKHDGNSKGWKKSHWWWRKGNDSWELQTTNKSKTSKEQLKNNEEEEEEEEYIKKNNKRRFLEFVLLTDEEYNKLIEKYGRWTIERKINDLNNYIWSKGKKYKSHYFTIMERLRKENIKPLEKKPEPPQENNNDLQIDTRASWLKEAFPLNK